MGTRHLIAAYIDGECKLAQYGQWDGYPEGAGEAVVKFLKGADLRRFAGKLRNTIFVPDDFITKEEWEANPSLVKAKHPQMTREAGWKVLVMIHNHKGPEPFPLMNSIDFAQDSLFCEYAYIINMDASVLEMYVGFNHEPVHHWQRFSEYGRNNGGYYPIKLVASYPFNHLPTTEEMVKDCERSEEVVDLLQKAERHADDSDS